MLDRVGADGIGMTMAWAGSASLANRTTTNNVAEYQGLIWGLAAAGHLRVDRIHVVGDSAMIIRQPKTNTSPRSPELRPLYAYARLLADQIGVNTWRHHYRAHNTLAYYLANAALSSAQDLMPSSNKQMSGAKAFMANDLGHWLTTQADC